MRTIAIAIAAALAAGSIALADEPAHGSPAAATPVKGKGSPGKPRAPVVVDARVGAGAAHLRIRFEAAGQGVVVRVYGVRGLQVTSPERPITGAVVAAGEVKELDVQFTAPAGQSHLAVAVSGRFAIGQRTAVQSFTVGRPSEAQRREAARGVQQTPSGERIKALPAQEPGH